MKLHETIKQCIKDIRSIIVGVFYDLRWKFKYEKKSGLLNCESRDVPVVVSLTSFPGRITTVDRTVKSLLMQKSVKPDSIQLWLASEQFPGGMDSLPEELKKTLDYGVEIKWCKDIRSYKKLVSGYDYNRHSIIVSTDDDVYYSGDWLKKLYDAYLLNPNVIHCHKATKFIINQNQYSIISGGKQFYNSPSYLNKLVGVGGVLYPPNCLHKDVTDEDLFTSLAPTNDDIWFWFMGILNGYKVNVVANNEPKPIEVYEKNKSDKLTDINDNGENLFWTQFRKMIEHYQTVDDVLKKEGNA